MSNVTFHKTRQGIIMMCGAMLLLPVLDCIAKILGEGGISSGQIVLFRFVLQVLLLFPILVITNRLKFNYEYLGLQIVRALAMGITTFCFFIAVKHMPLADSISIFFVEPMILTLLSVILLGEVIRLRRVVAIVIGFAGALIVIRPQFASVGVIAFLPLIAAFCFAVYMLITRYFSDKITPLQLQFQMGIIISPITALLMLAFPDTEGLHFVNPNWKEYQLLFLLGLVGALGHLLIVFATTKAPANLLAPFQYLEIVGATILGFMIFDNIPSNFTFFGISLIVASGIYLWYRENRVDQVNRTEISNFKR